MVEGVKARVLLDHGAQVSFIHKELLPAIKEKQSWTQTECHEKMGQQPIGATGAPLGVISFVHVWVVVDKTGESREVPCFVLASKNQSGVGNCIIHQGLNVNAMDKHSCCLCK